jgi:glycosyltransferase involved in cell wall biosynthesis
MKIAEVTATFPPYMAGTGNVCYHNAIELAKLGHEVTVFTSDFPNVAFRYPDNIAVKRLNCLFRIGNAPFIPQLLNLKGFDIIHLHYPFFFGAELILIASKLSKMDYVITYHNDTIGNGLFGIYFKLYRYFIMPLIMNNTKGIIVSSNNFAKNSFLNDNLKYYYKIIELPLGVDTTNFYPSVDPNPIKQKYRILDEKVILFVGALDDAHYFKGVEYLIKSFAKLKYRNVKLIIVGDGNLKGDFEKLAKIEGVSDRIIFVGNIVNEDLPAYYSASDFSVLPSTIESFGLVLIESMSVAKPVIVSDLPGVRPIVENNYNGLLFKSRDIDELTLKMDYLLNNDALCKEMGRNGRRVVEAKYSWDIIGKKLEKILLDLVKSKNNTS